MADRECGLLVLAERRRRLWKDQLPPKI